MTTDAGAEEQPEDAPVMPEDGATERPTPDSPEQPADDDTTPDDTDDDAPEDDGSDPLRIARREAANRRKELRTVQANLATANSTISTLQRQVAEQLITNDAALPYLHNAADLFDIGGANVTDLTDDTGGIDPGKLAAALTELKGARPYLFGDRPTTGFPLYEAMMRQGMPTPAPAGDTGAAWQKALHS